jgi:hypothetical protein
MCKTCDPKTSTEHHGSGCFHARFEVDRKGWLVLGFKSENVQPLVERGVDVRVAEDGDE